MSQKFITNRGHKLLIATNSLSSLSSELLNDLPSSRCSRLSLLFAQKPFICSPSSYSLLPYSNFHSIQRERPGIQQPYEIQVYDDFVMRGNIGVLRCHIPAFVRDNVQFVSWLRSDGLVLSPDLQQGEFGKKNFLHNFPEYFSSNLSSNLSSD